MAAPYKMLPVHMLMIMLGADKQALTADDHFNKHDLGEFFRIHYKSADATLRTAEKAGWVAKLPRGAVRKGPKSLTHWKVTPKGEAAVAWWVSALTLSNI